MLYSNGIHAGFAATGAAFRGEHGIRMNIDDLMKDFPENPKGIPQQSPGLRGTSYPGKFVHTESQPQRGCAGGSQPRRNPFRVVKFERTATQGRRVAPTLGWETKSLWDSRENLHDLCDAPIETAPRFESLAVVVEP